MTNLNRKVGEMDFDGLITDLTPPVQVRGGVIATAGVYVRGTVFAKSSSDNKLHVLGAEGEGLTPDCVLCDDITTEEADATVAVYTAGCFDPEKVTLADGYTMTEADKDGLRERGIVFKAASPAN